MNLLLHLLVNAWPILVIVVLVLAGVAAWIALPATLIVAIIQQRIRWHEIKFALKYGLEPKVLVLLISVIFYKAVIEASGSVNVLIADLEVLKLPLVFIVALLPFIIGLATGFSMAFVGIALPLITPLIAQSTDVNHFAMLLAYTSGEIGVLLSPLHLCLILSTKYFEARLSSVYRFIIPPVVMMETIAIILFLTFS